MYDDNDDIGKKKENGRIRFAPPDKIISRGSLSLHLFGFLGQHSRFQKKKKKCVTVFRINLQKSKYLYSRPKSFKFQ
ncbi:hypothetical protein Phum_PHUM019000 [Pediculus humanus corporis]|uniref:Uncharacterized protein n=1 Tax=Pediculus humanus subsp. corporis TaxID=121224 RepID=E0V9P3_PEDHC|nr:uncharacterized protein Phum_PHUM019000 [Pediculus humanus corporis]EEB10112.1 hypothetical protein Phum_PHUM019000 [Pediculus humanus corporis]